MSGIVTTVAEALSRCPYRDRIDFVAHISVELSTGLIEHEIVEVVKGVVLDRAINEPNLWLEYEVAGGSLRATHVEGDTIAVFSSWLLGLSVGLPDVERLLHNIATGRRSVDTTGGGD